MQGLLHSLEGEQVLRAWRETKKDTDPRDEGVTRRECSPLIGSVEDNKVDIERAWFCDMRAS